MSPPPLESRFAGAMLGTFVGDAIGQPFEGVGPDVVAFAWEHVLSGDQFLPRIYTDDTQMMIGVAESLIACGGVDAGDMATRFAENYDDFRGYGPGASAILCAIRDGMPWADAATSVFPDGSFGNGAAMRVAPIGLFYHREVAGLQGADEHPRTAEPQEDAGPPRPAGPGRVEGGGRVEGPDREARPGRSPAPESAGRPGHAAELRRAAELSASITHAHPLGKEGAALQAFAVALAARSESEGFDPARFLAELRVFVRPELEEYTLRLAAIKELLRGDPSADEVIDVLGNDVRAQAAVPAAIYAFLANHGSFAAAVTCAIHLGGDADTIGAMTGAIAGALHGIEAIPAMWLDTLENGEKGRDYVLELANRLAERFQSPV